MVVLQGGKSTILSPQYLDLRALGIKRSLTFTQRVQHKVCRHAVYIVHAILSLKAKGKYHSFTNFT